MTRFNRICFTIALFWLSISIPTGLIIRPTIPDFSQFYTAGTLISMGKWTALYPMPWRGSLDNAGLHSSGKNDWVQISAKRGAPNYTHFILPPPSALLFAPLSLLSYVQAFWVWTFLLSAAMMGTALISADLLREVFRKQTRWEGILVLLIVLSPVTARSIRIANVTPFIALSIAYLLRSLLRDQSARGAMAIIFGALLKYATLILAPLPILLRRGKMIVWCVGIGELVIASTFYIAGYRPFLEFYRIILPTLNRPSAYLGNQTLPGLLARSFGRPLSPLATEILEDLRIATLTVMVFALLRLRASRSENIPIYLLSAAALLISWLLIFSPVAWEHWAVFLCPTWGWLIWEILRPGWRRACAISSLALMYFPAGIIQVPGFATYPIQFPEPLNSSQLAGFVLLFVLSFSRLYGKEIAIQSVSTQYIEQQGIRMPLATIRTRT